jgi:hypothetical protein
MTRILLFVVLLSSRAFPQIAGSGQPWDRLFIQSWIAQKNGELSKARSLTEEGWTLVKAAGPSAFGYADGVEQAYATYVAVAGPLPASRFYSEALKATESPGFLLVRLQILIHKAFRYSHHEEVEANSAYEEALALIQSMQTPPGYFAQLLGDFAELKGRMGDPESAGKLLARAASAPSYAPIPYPRFGMRDVPTDQISGYNPDVIALADEVSRLLRERQYERARVTADLAFAVIDALPGRERGPEDEYYERIASGYSASGHKSDAIAVYEREIAASEQLSGPESPAVARTLERVAWRYINDLRMLGPARELVERAARIVSVSDGETSDAMSFIEDTRLRLAQLEGNSDAVAELKAKIRGIWVAVHGANTKPLVVN